MFLQREFRSALIIGFAAAISGNALAQTTVFPATHVGELTTFAVEHHRTDANVDFSKQLTFSLSEASDIRIDMRAVDKWFKYGGGSLSMPAFKLFDSAHTLLGTSAVDATFDMNHASICHPIYGGTNWCFSNVGVTLAKQLNAGNYSIEFSGHEGGYFGLDVYFGIAKNEAALLDNYLLQVTPAEAVPETSTWAMMLIGFLGLRACARKGRQRA